MFGDISASLQTHRRFAVVVGGEVRDQLGSGGPVHPRNLPSQGIQDFRSP